MFSILFPVFSGCLLNVFILETILAQNKLGIIITFCQFVLTACTSYIENADFVHGRPSRLWMPSHAVPLRKFIYIVVMFFTVSVLNNWVYRYDISVPMYTIIRSSSPVITMCLGFLRGQRYSLHQVVSAAMICVGIVTITIPRNFELGGGQHSSFSLGVGLLILSSFISSFIGLYNESLVRQYGNHWKESLFYTHFLGLPLFAFTYPVLRREFAMVMASPKNSYGVPQQVANLALNLSMQLICVRGVNRLAASTSSLTVTVILLVRKVVSLLLSMWWYGNSMEGRERVGGLLVLVGTVYYSVGNRKKKVD